MVMDKNRIEGAGDKAKGAMKEAAGKMTGDTKLQAEGKLDKAKGSMKNAIGGAKDAMRQAKH
ncbi:MAG TPA: CsbD family protein [Caulobacteraceae bacterium]|nr:CsbD family protein [Caulobacteraceae bacterium]